MQQINVVIGPFRRPAFGEGLAARLSQHPALSVTSTEVRGLGTAARTLAAPVVLVLDAAQPGIDLESLRRTAGLSFILIYGEGREARLHLNCVGSDIVEALVLTATGRTLACAAVAPDRPTRQNLLPAPPARQHLAVAAAEVFERLAARAAPQLWSRC